jgi:phosphomannomutase/phosphoglucomutase
VKHVEKRVFRAYDIRGIYPNEINEEFAKKIGKAFGTFIGKNKKIVIGSDCRLSSPSLKQNLIEGLTSTGITVIDIGIVPTPLVIFTVAYYGFDGGVQVTASHNPKEYNGFLFYGKKGIPIGQNNGLLKIKEIFEKGKFITGNGSVTKKNIFTDYKKFVLEKVDIKSSKLKVVVDAGNGVAGIVVPKILKEVGVEVFELFCELDGNFPNREPEPTPENLGTLRKKVLEINADLGLAYDGDCDRLVAIDEKGNILQPAELFGIFIKSYLEKGGKKVVHDALTSAAVDELIKKYNGLPIACRVGHVFIHSKLLEEEAVIGGEVSGHYFFKEMFGADDVIFATLKLIEYLTKSGKKLSQCYEKLSYPYETFRIKTLEERKFEFIEKLKEKFEKSGYKVDCLDGVKVIFDDGWALFRASQTEPKISIAFEAKDKESFEKIKNFVEKIVKTIPK